MKGISIIICCYNSAKRLPETLRHICQQQVEASIPWEVIVVNNNSSDNTAEVAKDLLIKYQCPAPYFIHANILDKHQKAFVRKQNATT